MIALSHHRLHALLIILFFFACLFFCISDAEAATLSISPPTGVYTAGKNFTVSVLVNTSGSAINASDGTLTFNPSELSVVSVSKGPIFNLWTADPSFSNSAGTISFSGGSPTGYTGSNGVVLTATVRAKASGAPKISFSSGSVLAADGRGTNVLTKMNGANFTISAEAVVPDAEVIEYIAPANTPSAPVVTSATHSDPSKWYTGKEAVLSWNVPAGVSAVRTLLDEHSGSIPTKVYDSPINSLAVSDLEEGVQYFHIQFKNGDGWGRIAHYRLAIDTEKPTAFTIERANGSDSSNPSQTLSLLATDTTSLVKRYLVQVDGGEPYEFIDETASRTITLPPLDPGHHSVIIEGFDEAGNSIIGSFSFDIEAFEKPRFVEYPHEINEQVIPVIKGVTKPNSKVEVTLLQLGLGVSQAQAIQTKEVMSSESGEFVFIPDGKLSLGVYELTAFATDEYGARSEVSDPIRIAVQQPGYLRIGSLVVSFLSVLIPLLSLCALLFVGVWFVLIRFRFFKRGVYREASEAHKILAQEFSKLQGMVRTQQMELTGARKGKKLTKAEEALFMTLAEALKASERRVQKEIVDVESLVD